MLQITEKLIRGTARVKDIKKYGIIKASLIDTEENRIQKAIKKRLNRW